LFSAIQLDVTGIYRQLQCDNLATYCIWQIDRLQLENPIRLVGNL